MGMYLKKKKKKGKQIIICGALLYKMLQAAIEEGRIK